MLEGCGDFRPDRRLECDGGCHVVRVGAVCSHMYKVYPALPNPFGAFKTAVIADQCALVNGCLFDGSRAHVRDISGEVQRLARAHAKVTMKVIHALFLSLLVSPTNAQINQDINGWPFLRFGSCSCRAMCPAIHMTGQGGLAASTSRVTSLLVPGPSTGAAYPMQQPSIPAPFVSDLAGLVEEPGSREERHHDRRARPPLCAR